MSQIHRLGIETGILPCYSIFGIKVRCSFSPRDSFLIYCFFPKMPEEEKSVEPTSPPEVEKKK
jgi:hypothetical protein